MPIYNRGDVDAAQDRRGGSNQLWGYLTYGRYELGSNRCQRRDMAMMQSALITCFPVYHIDKLSADNSTLFYNGKMCECI